MAHSLTRQSGILVDWGDQSIIQHTFCAETKIRNVENGQKISVL